MCPSSKDAWRIWAYCTYCGVAHPQTNGKMWRVHGELQRSLFEDVAGPLGSACPINPPRIEKDPIARFMKWYNYDRLRMSLDTTIEETPAMAFKRKTPPDRDRTYRGMIDTSLRWVFVQSRVPTSFATPYQYVHARIRPVWVTCKAALTFAAEPDNEDASYGRYAAHTDVAYLPHNTKSHYDQITKY